MQYVYFCVIWILCCVKSLCNILQHVHSLSERLLLYADFVIVSDVWGVIYAYSDYIRQIAMWHLLAPTLESITLVTKSIKVREL